MARCPVFVLAFTCVLLTLGLLASDTEPTPPLQSDSARTLSLGQAIAMALAHSPAMEAARSRIDAARGRTTQAGTWPNPELEFAVEEWPVNRGGSFSDGKQTLGVMQTLPFPGKKALARQAGQAAVRMRELETAWRQTELERDIKAAYAQVLTAERAKELTARLAEVAESSAESARRKTEAGATAFQEQLRAEIQQEQTAARLAEAERELALARNTLATLMGHPDLIDAALSSPLDEKPDINRLATSSMDWLQHHPSVQAAQMQIVRAELDLRRARLAPYPDVNVGVAGGRLGETDQSILEFRLAVPLPVLDRAQGQKEEARAELSTAQAEHRSVEHQLRRAWVNAQERYRTAAEQVAAYQLRLLPKTAEAMRLVRLGFEEGKYGFMDLLDTQRTAAEAQLDYLGKLLEMNIAKAEIEALTKPWGQTVNPSP